MIELTSSQDLKTLITNALYRLEFDTINLSNYEFDLLINHAPIQLVNRWHQIAWLFGVVDTIETKQLVKFIKLIEFDIKNDNLKIITNRICEICSIGDPNDIELLLPWLNPIHFIRFYSPVEDQPEKIALIYGANSRSGLINSIYTYPLDALIRRHWLYRSFYRLVDLGFIITNFCRWYAESGEPIHPRVKWLVLND